MRSHQEMKNSLTILSSISIAAYWSIAILLFALKCLCLFALSIIGIALGRHKPRVELLQVIDTGGLCVLAKFRLVLVEFVVERWDKFE